MILINENGQQKLYFENGSVVYPDELLSGMTNAYQIEQNIIAVSPAIFKCMQDDQIKNTVMEQVKIIDLRETIKDIVAQEINNLID